MKSPRPIKEVLNEVLAELKQNVLIHQAKSEKQRKLIKPTS